MATAKKPAAKPTASKTGPKPRPSNAKVAEAREHLDLRAADEKESIFKAILDAALGGDMSAAGILCSRIWPVRRGAAIRFKIPHAKDAAGIGVAIDVLLAQAAEGVLTLEEAKAAASILEGKLKAFEAGEVSDRIGKLEEALEALRTGQVSPLLTNGKGASIQ